MQAPSLSLLPVEELEAIIAYQEALKKLKKTDGETENGKDNKKAVNLVSVQGLLEIHVILRTSYFC